MGKRLSAFNIRMRSLLNRGVKFARAAKIASGKVRSSASRARSSVSRARSKVGEIMARRRSRRGGFRTSSRRSSRRGASGFGMLRNPVNFASRAGNAYMVGLGTQILVEKYAAMVGQPGFGAAGKFVGAFVAFQTGGGIPGAAAAVPLVLNGGMSKLSAPVSNGGGRNW